MDWLDYRDKLGIGFSDDDKTELFYTKIYNHFILLSEPDFEGCISIDEYWNFCNNVGSPVGNEIEDMTSGSRIKKCIDLLFSHTDDLCDFLSYYVAFINSINTEKESGKGHHLVRSYFVNILTKSLTESHILFDILNDGDKYFLFPKGAQELDDALVSEPLQWLEEYPQAHNIFCHALRQYQNGNNFRDTADNLRKTLEEFLREFLDNDKDLHSNKAVICRYLGQHNVDGSISGLYDKIISIYDFFNNELIKHHDRLDPNLLEFVLYQTGLLIRMPLVVKQSETVE